LGLALRPRARGMKEKNRRAGQSKHEFLHKVSEVQRITVATEARIGANREEGSTGNIANVERLCQ
jgi:hypothetical protein